MPPEPWYMRDIRDKERKIKRLEREKEELQKELEQERRKRKRAEDELKNIAEKKQAKRPRFPDHSLSKQEKLRTRKKAQIYTGRKSRVEKLKEVNREEDIYPADVLPQNCVLAYDRIVTHIINGKKEVVLYRIHKEKWGKRKGKLPSVLPRSDYGLEVAVIVAFLIYSIGVSHSQACQILRFFCQLEIGESELDCLLNQLGKNWEKEFDNLADLILLSFVVHIDETGWRVGRENCFTWIFTTITNTLLLYGEKRDEEVLDRILPLGKFKGVGVSDCYRIYVNRFKEAQKCWAHFLRKAIKLMLLYPEKEEYKTFFEGLFEIFAAGKKFKENEDPNKKEKGIEVLKLKVLNICKEKETRLFKDTAKDWREFVNLQKSLVKNLDDLFTFVLIPEVEPTNNRAERGFRRTAIARNNYQTSKTKKGAKRRSIIASVLTSLKQSLPDFSLQSVTEEVVKWRESGQSLFQKQLIELKAVPP